MAILDEVITIYNHAKNAAEQVPTMHRILPVDLKSFVPEGERYSSLAAVMETRCKTILTLPGSY